MTDEEYGKLVEGFEDPGNLETENIRSLIKQYVDQCPREDLVLILALCRDVFYE